jgi:N-acetylglucosamine-6-phosphate deacetylase
MTAHSRILLRNVRIVTDAMALENHAVLIEGSYIRAVAPDADLLSVACEQMLNLESAWLFPGFIDTQVNGGGGVLFNDTPDLATLLTMRDTHRRFGTTSFLPTCISDDSEVLVRAIQAVQQAIAQKVPGVLGIHIEGPFLNPTRRGVHDTRKIRPLDEEALQLLTAPRLGRTLITLAPEITTPAIISRLVQSGTIVSAGHTDASYETIRAALDHGLSGFTHLFNAMSPLMPRAPGVTGAALEDRNSWCGIIADGHHVSPVVLRIAFQCKPKEKLMLVTDAMPMVGIAPSNAASEQRFDLQGRAISVRDGICRDETGVLAGSNLDMASAVRNAVELMGATRAQAAQMASYNPAAFLGLSRELGRIAVGYRANMVLLDDQFKVLRTWIDGESSTHF